MACKAIVKPTTEKRKMEVDRKVLELLVDGKDLESIHADARKYALSRLRMQGCIDVDGLPTDLGDEIADMRIAIPYGLMLAKAIEFGIEGDMAIIVAILEIGSVVDHNGRSWQDLLCEDDLTSDAIAQMRVFRAFNDMGESERHSYYVHGYNFSRVARRSEELLDMLHEIYDDVRAGPSEDEAAIHSCIEYGLRLYLYAHVGGGEYISLFDPYPRRLGRESVLKTGAPREWLLGMPNDIGELNPEAKPMRLLHGATTVDPSGLAKVHPELSHTRTRPSKHYNPNHGGLVKTRELCYMGLPIAYERVYEADENRLRVLKAAERIKFRACCVLESGPPDLTRQLFSASDAELDLMSQDELTTFIEATRQLLESIRESCVARRQPIRSAKTPAATTKPKTPDRQPRKPLTLTHRLSLTMQQMHNFAAIIREVDAGRCDRLTVKQRLNAAIERQLLARSIVRYDADGTMAIDGMKAVKWGQAHLNEEILDATDFRITEGDMSPRQVFDRLGNPLVLVDVAKNWRIRLRHALARHKADQERV